MIRLMILLLVLALPGVAAAQPLGQERNGPGVVVPIPDPTLLTTAQLNREIELLKQQIEQLILGLRELVHLRIESVEETIQLRNQKVDDQIQARNIELQNRSEAIGRQIHDMQQLIEEKFQGVDTQITEKFLGIQRQFEERDTRVAQTSVDSKLAIDAALQAAKEAVGKSELGTKDVIQQQGDLLRTVTAALGANLDDLKQRTTAIESKTLGIGEARGALTDNTGILVGLGGLILAAITMIFSARKTQTEPQIRYVQVQPPPQPQPGITTTTNTSAA